MNYKPSWFQGYDDGYTAARNYADQRQLQMCDDIDRLTRERDEARREALEFRRVATKLLEKNAQLEAKLSKVAEAISPF